MQTGDNFAASHRNDHPNTRWLFQEFLDIREICSKFRSNQVDFWLTIVGQGSIQTFPIAKVHCSGINPATRILEFLRHKFFNILLNGFLIQWR